MGLIDTLRRWSSGAPKARLRRSRTNAPAGLPEGATEGFFDPALKHFGRGLRAGDPAMPSATRTAAWREGCEAALRSVVFAAATCPAADALVLRGGMTVRAWCGSDARRPRDLDLVVTPASLSADGGDAEALLQTLADAVVALPPLGATFARDVGLDAIWTYARAEGRRLTFFTTVEGFDEAFPLGVDVVFGQPLRDAPSPLRLETPHGDATLRAASPRESLAWKVLWLVSDWFPMPKDAYDAMILARRLAADDRASLQALLNEMAPTHGDGLRAEEVALPGIAALLRRDGILHTEWTHFAAEYPDLAQLGPDHLLDGLDDALRAGT
jgi:hypothetical protein